MLASLGVAKSDADVSRKITMSLTSDYETEEITIPYREGITRSENENITRQRYVRIPAPKSMNVEQALFSNRAGLSGRAGRGNHASNIRSRNRGEKGSSSSNPQPPRETPPQLSTK